MSGQLDPWAEYADACGEHDPEHGAHALAEIGPIPSPRTAWDPADASRIGHALLPHEHDPRPSLWRQLLAEVRGRHAPTCRCGQ